MGLSTRGKEDSLMEDHPYNSFNRAFSIGTITGEDEKIPGPGVPSTPVEKVELFVNPGNISDNFDLVFVSLSQILRHQ